jgi:DNA-binding MarR family transcriptional regulator
MSTPDKNDPGSNASPPQVQERIHYLRTHREEIAGRLISVTARCGMMYMTKRLARFGIGSGQAFILAELFNKDDVSQDEVRCLVKTDKGTITRAIQRLEDLGFISRKQDSHDRRVVRVFVTEKARGIEQEFFAVLHSWNEGILKGVTTEEERMALSVLGKMAANAEIMAHGCE